MNAPALSGAVAPLLDVERLTIAAVGPDGRPRPVLTDVGLRLLPGEAIGIVGESGCGKSTLGLALLGYLRPGLTRVAGHVRFAGQDLFAPDAPLEQMRGRQIAFVPQNAAAALTPGMTIGQQLDEALRLHTGAERASRRETALALLADLQLTDPAVIVGRYPHELSGGQQQRCVLGLALAGDPRVLVLDEPTTALDAATQAGVLEALRRTGERRGIAMVYISHNFGVVARNCDRVAVMYAGELVETGATPRLLRSPAHPYTRGLLASLPSIRRPGLPAAMPGTPPAPGVAGLGCRFAPRCPHAAPECARHPELSQAGPGASVRCHFPDPPAAAAAARDGRDRRPGEALLEVAGLGFTYGQGGYLGRLLGRPTARRTLDDLSFTLRAGETLGVVGESGSGKSTLLRLLLGLQRPEIGSARLADEDLTLPLARRPLELRRQIQIVFQNPGGTLNPRQTIADIIESPLRLYFPALAAQARRRRAIELLDQVRLGAHHLARYPEQLSGGEKQRVAIARALAAEPRLILCDEVTSALDVSVQAAILQLLDRVQAETGAALILVSHDIAVVRAVADRVVVLHEGRICEAGAAVEVFGSPSHPYTATLLANSFDPEAPAPEDPLPFVPNLAPLLPLTGADP